VKKQHIDKLLEKKTSELPTDELLCDLADLFKIFGDTTRVKIMFVLLKKDLCVNDIANLLNMSQSAISHQLKNLKDNNLVASKRDGKSIIYFLADDHVKTILGQGFEHLIEKRKN